MRVGEVQWPARFRARAGIPPGGGPGVPQGFISGSIWGSWGGDVGPDWGVLLVFSLRISVQILISPSPESAQPITSLSAHTHIASRRKISASSDRHSASHRVAAHFVRAHQIAPGARRPARGSDPVACSQVFKGGFLLNSRKRRIILNTEDS